MSSDPPSYDSAVTSSGFPSSYFVIKSAANGRVLDVEHSSSADGTPIVAWPESETSLVEGLRSPAFDNQLFFISEDGYLCSKASGHALDVENGSLVLRRRRPMTYPFPNAYSHPVPRFKYNPETEQISVVFSCDPSYMSDPNLESSSPSFVNWTSKMYLLTTLPMRREKSIVEDAADFFINTTNLLTAPVANLFAPLSPRASSITAEDVSRGEFDLREDEVLETERAPHEEQDDSLEPLRILRVIALPIQQNLDQALSSPAQMRCRWKILPLLKVKTRTGMR